MKIGLINFHYAYNYGAVLQCTALKRKLEDMGNEVCVIDYRPAYQQQYYVSHPNPFSSALWAYRKFKRQSMRCTLYHMVGRFVRVALSYGEANKRRKLRERFEPFTEKHLNLTRRYKAYNELKENAPLCDAYVCGSDQLWNPSVTWGLDPAYFLNFGPENIKRIAYAISPCSPLDVGEYSEELRKYTKVLNNISLRESEKQNELESLLGRSIDVCQDPTLFLRENEYTDYESAIPEDTGSYILVYAFSDDKYNDSLYRTARIVSERLGLEVIDISLDTFVWPFEVKRKYGVSPGEFLSYIKNAAFIVTNSFHGTVFSIVYHKTFLTIPKNGTSSRMSELLSSLGMSDRLVLIDNIENALFNDNIDYEDVDVKLEKLCGHGQTYLESSL